MPNAEKIPSIPQDSTPNLLLQIDEKLNKLLEFQRKEVVRRRWKLVLWLTMVILFVVAPLVISYYALSSLGGMFNLSQLTNPSTTQTSTESLQGLQKLLNNTGIKNMLPGMNVLEQIDNAK
jgi:hypothetical protein